MADDIKNPDEIEAYLVWIEEELSENKKIRNKIKSLEIELPTHSSERTIARKQTVTTEPEVMDFCNSIEEFGIYLDDYSKFTGETVDELACILPHPDDYHYEDILLRLHAESLKTIKEISEYAYDDPSVQEDAHMLIEREKHKIELLQQLLTREEENESDMVEFNHIILVPNMNGNIRFLEDLGNIPSDHYPEVYQLLGTIIKGTFKRLKRLRYGTNSSLIGGFTEVRGSRIRILFQRLNYDTYAVFSVFMKKAMNDSVLQNLFRNRIREYRDVEDRVRENISNPEFMKLNEQFLSELWRKLGYSEAPKVYRKDINE